MDFDPGSFRDRDGRVFHHDGSVFRVLSEEAARDWESLSKTAFFPRLMSEGKIIRTERVEPPVPLASDWTVVLRHETVPFISYPYEWTFEMLKDAALLQLEILLAAMAEDMILKDATAYNIQWIGSKPAFIDVSSFERMQPGRPWAGYRQFCQLFLNPLFLQAYKDLPFQTWLRGDLDGIDPEDCLKMMSARDLLRPGIFKHVYLHAKVQAKYGSTDQDLNRTFQAAGFHKDMIRANVKGLLDVINNLEWKRKVSTWSGYAEQNSYAALDRETKESFVAKAVGSQDRKLVWDLGCNTGAFSRIAAARSDRVIAMDSDPLTIELLYRDLKKEQNTKILPLVSNVANPAPDHGWNGRERRSLSARGKPDLVLCLALIHHLVIAANIPLTELIAWLASLQADLVIEFVSKQDPMVKKLLLNKRDIYADYDQMHLENLLKARYNVQNTVTLSSGTRTLYHCEAR